MLRAVIVLLLLCLSLPTLAQKEVVGETLDIKLPAAGFSMKARIDSGATISSIHALDIEVIGGAAKNIQDDVGKKVRFTTENRLGERKRLEARIVKVGTVSNALGAESRYTVELALNYGKDARTVRLNLRDRSDMEYKLLLGRNWLSGRYLVDVAEKQVIGERAAIHVVETGLLFDTRIDTGADESSLHAIELEVEGGDATNMSANIGKMLSFTTANEKGKKQRLSARIVDVSLVRSAQGMEGRYLVDLTIGERGKEYKTRVNLKDRTGMSQKLLIGRNWLKGNYVVDVSR
ncbi:RimK/LysX family protein [Shewanella sp. JM162201]|uniref:RimK/LysX family protein n=1 Tax=Shewanella jiangmenensis TaxID=2837387 RepID=A0ABS5V585_9GAMM|nr:RimK/LysX family protein [Shewanella jiangmenensis]MBT1445605.1 RimK/LysX family protein [Shewanella jiangmenensis]